MKVLFVYLLVTGLFLSSFAQPEELSNTSDLQLRTIFQPEKQGIFRGVVFNLRMDLVMKHEAETQIYAEDSGYVAYTIFLSDDESEFADIYYDFDEKGLFSITIETYLDSSATAGNLFEATGRFLTNKYGAGVLLEDGYTVWKATDPATGLNYEIAIIDISAPEDAGLVFELYVVE